ncbi:MAG TPA: serine/threonine-protein kinase, partial [Kofleriaceae bacterium]
MAARDLATAIGWSCPTCGRSYPSEFAVCPLDATPQGEPSRSGDPQIGIVLGHTYKIVRVIGQGGMARLYEAEHLRIDARYAVKIIHDELAREPSLLARFEREAHAAGKIRSDHVVRLFDVLRTQDDRPCLITELLHGEDLQVHLDRVGKLSVADAIPIARQLCRGVAAAHAVGVVHRDLKPSNVFLCQREGTPLVKVFDFGVAKIEADEKLTHTGAVMGTAAYMAPEQALRAADAGPLADVYSIGAILYHMLAGQPPYGSLPAVSRFALLLSEEPARPRSVEPSIPEGVEAVIQHAMARDTASRIPSALEL